MADQVQRNLEDMIPELEDLIATGIFSQEEIRAIVKQRTSLEYACARRQSEKLDYLKYIQYEINLELLKKKRKKKMGIKRLTNLGENASTRRIHRIFTRLLKRYKNDLKLWYQYIQYCTNVGSYRVLSRVFVNALRNHPMNSSLWIMAASWEFEHNNNINGARALLQRGLRICKGDTRLWHEYTRLELLYQEKIKLRVELLGIDAAQMVASTEDSIDISSVPDAEDEGEDLPLEANTSQKTKDEKNPFFTGAVIEFIYKNAIAHIPDDYKFRLGFIDVLREYKDTKHLISMIYDDVLEHFPTSEECWSHFARQDIDKIAFTSSIDDDEEIKKRAMDAALEFAVGVYERAVVELPTTKMWHEYTAFCVEQIESNGALLGGGKVEQERYDPILPKEYSVRLIDIGRRADEAETIDEFVVFHWANSLLSLGDVDSAVDVVTKATNETLPTSSLLWEFRLKLTLQVESFANDCPSEAPQQNGKKGGRRKKQREKQSKKRKRESEEEEREKKRRREEVKDLEENAKDLFSRALDSLPVDDSLRIRSYFLEFCVVSGLAFDVVLTYFEKMMWGVCNRKESNQLKTHFLTFVASSKGVEFAQILADRAVKFPPNTKEFLKECIRVEKCAHPVDLSRVRTLYQRLVEDHGTTDHDVWLEFISFESDNGNFKTVQDLHWKAKKQLDDPSLFIEKYSVLIS